MSEELEPVLNIDQTNKGNNINASSKFANQEDDNMSDYLDAVLNVNDLVGGSTIKKEQSKFNKDVQLDESDSNSAQEDDESGE